jgi:hypothetical protein
MTTEIGQTALIAVATVRQQDALRREKTRHARALWLFRNDQSRFRRAEEAAFFENARRGRTWDGFVAPAELKLHRDARRVRTLAVGIQRFFREGEKVKIELFDRNRIDTDGTIKELVQVAVYREGLSDSVDVFKSADDIGPLIYQPVHELAFTYEPHSGVIEVVAQHKARREELAMMFAKTLLLHEIGGERVPLRHYDLSVFMEEKEFDYDPEDGIDDVRLRLVKLQTMEGRAYVTIEARTEEETVHAVARRMFGERDPFSGGHLILEVVLSVHFKPDSVNPRGRTIAVKLHDPNGSDLKDKTDKERLLSEKYLKRWKVIQELID